MRTRREFLTTMVALGATAQIAAWPARAADAPIELDWGDLIPERGDGFQIPEMMGIIEHGQMSMPETQSSVADVTTEFNGKTVRIPGYVVPIDYTSEGATSLLLVPYVGACIHVPPPPPNQLVFVTTDRPYEFEGLFEAVWVTGVFNSGASKTELADVGYSITDGEIEEYKW